MSSSTLQSLSVCVYFTNNTSFETMHTCVYFCFAKPESVLTFLPRQICTCTSISVRQLYPFAQSLPPFALPVAHAPPLFASLYLTFVSVCATPDSAYLCFAITDLPTNHFCAFSTPPKGICVYRSRVISAALSLSLPCSFTFISP